MKQRCRALFIVILSAVFFPLTAWAYGGFDSRYPGSVRVQTDENRDGYYLRAYLEGLRPEDIQIRVRHNRLVLSVARSDPSSRWRMRFRKQLRLPYDADWARMTSSTREGVMEIYIPRHKPYVPGDVDFSKQGFYSPYPIRQ